MSGGEEGRQVLKILRGTHDGKTGSDPKMNDSSIKEKPSWTKRRLNYPLSGGLLVNPPKQKRPP